MFTAMKAPPDMTSLRIGSRGSQLALVQANMVKARLLALNPKLAIEICVITTTGDVILDRNLTQIGGKGLFIKEIEEALLANRIDIAVHSMKDLPAELPDGLEIACVLEREDPRDVLVSAIATSLETLPIGAVVGTSSPRRAAQALYARPDLRIVPFRGNVPTRLAKVRNGEVDATFLALAGLKRLGLENEKDCYPVSTEHMLPAVAQGAIGIELRTSDIVLKALLAPLNHAPTAIGVSAERAFLGQFEGSCHTPVAALSTLSPKGDILHLQCLIASPDGRRLLHGKRKGPSAQAESLGADVARELRTQGGEGFFD